MFKNNNLEEMIKNKKKLTSITNYNKKDYNLPDNGWIKVCYTCENIKYLYIILKKKKYKFICSTNTYLYTKYYICNKCQKKKRYKFLKSKEIIGIYSNKFGYLYKR